MENVFDWSEPLLAAASRMLHGILDYLPQLFGAIALLLLGWFAARALRALTVRIMRSFDRLSGALGLGGIFATRQVNESVVAILGNVAFWLINLFFLAAATNLLGLTLFSGWLDSVIGHLPKLLSGALIIFAGVVFGNLVSDAVRTASQSMSARQRALLARGAQLFTVATMIVIGVDQIGIDITILITVMAIAVGALLGGVAIAFSLGSRNLVSNLIGARYLNRDYRIGEPIRIDGVEGTILEISPIAVILETEEGRMTIPAKTFSEMPSLLLHRETTDA